MCGLFKLKNIVSLVLVMCMPAFAFGATLDIQKESNAPGIPRFVKVCGASDQLGPICVLHTEIRLTEVFDMADAEVVHPEILVIEGQCSAMFWAEENEGTEPNDTLTGSAGKVRDELSFEPARYALECSADDRGASNFFPKAKNFQR